jgi:hypothetical protein
VHISWAEPVLLDVMVGATVMLMEAEVSAAHAPD